MNSEKRYRYWMAILSGVIVVFSCVMAATMIGVRIYSGVGLSIEQLPYDLFFLVGVVLTVRNIRNWRRGVRAWVERENEQTRRQAKLTPP